MTRMHNVLDFHVVSVVVDSWVAMGYAYAAYSVQLQSTESFLEAIYSVRTRNKCRSRRLDEPVGTEKMETYTYSCNSPGLALSS